MSLPPLLNRQAIHERLLAIIPVGIAHRNYCTRELAASTVFTALYVNGVDGQGYFGPKHVYRMSDEQALLTSDEQRTAYANDMLKAGGQPLGGRWYQDTTREPIRDETLREGLVAIGAVSERKDLPTTSSKPRYSLTTSFAALFDPGLTGEAFEAAADAWRSATFSAGAKARIALLRKGATKSDDKVLVTFPNGETQHLVPGPSSQITKAVIEVFAPRFLSEPVVLFVSESGNKVVARHDDVARSIGLDIKADKHLPDIVLADLRTDQDPLLVFIEVVATDGPINERRKVALAELAANADFEAKNVAYVTAYLDRDAGPFRKNVDSLAWGSYAWFAAEPERIIEFSEGRDRL